MAIVKACRISNTVKNSGKECDISMGPTAMILAVPPRTKITEAQLADPSSWIDTLIHEARPRRVYPLFGQHAPIRAIDNGAGTDVTVTMDDGATIFVRYGMYNRTFQTTSGGLCYAEMLMSFNKENYSIIEIDQAGQMLFRKNEDGTYGGLITSAMFSPAPILATFTDVYRNRFQITYDPSEMVRHGVIFEGGASILSKMGLIDTAFKAASVASSTTKLRFQVLTDCAQTNLLDLFPTSLPLTANFVVKDKATGAVVPITAAAKVGDNIELTGTFVSGKTYTITGAEPATWRFYSVEGYDGTVNPLDIKIP